MRVLNQLGSGCVVLLGAELTLRKPKVILPLSLSLHPFSLIIRARGMYTRGCGDKGSVIGPRMCVYLYVCIHDKRP